MASGNWITTEVCVMAANDLNGINDASFSGNGLVGFYHYSGSTSAIGFYALQAPANTYVAVSAPNYQTTYFYTGSVPLGSADPQTHARSIYLTYIGGWPQTY
jgi:hypothetical protein